MTNDPMYNSQPKEFPGDGICTKCGGVFPGLVAYPGEWPCQCEPEEPDPDASMEEYLLRKHGKG